MVNTQGHEAGSNTAVARHWSQQLRHINTTAFLWLATWWLPLYQRITLCPSYRRSRSLTIVRSHTSQTILCTLFRHSRSRLWTFSMLHVPAKSQLRTECPFLARLNSNSYIGKVILLAAIRPKATRGTLWLLSSQSWWFNIHLSRFLTLSCLHLTNRTPASGSTGWPSNKSLRVSPLTCL